MLRLLSYILKTLEKGGVMDKVHLEAFTFEAGVDYLPYYKKFVFHFNQSQTLKDILHFLKSEIEGYGCDTSALALRINGIAVFEDIDIIELIQQFGEQWQIEPLSTYYASKDLLFDRQMLWKRYESFFVWAEFLSVEEKEEFEKYLALNLITPMRNDTYLGDGFFLYLKWIFSRHPDRIKAIREWILDKQSGILNFVSLADMVYPRANAIDEEIWEIMRNIVFSSESKRWKHLYTLKVQK